MSKSRPGPQAARSVAILLVEDDAGVRQVTARALRRFGYQVHEAADGVEGLRLAADRSLEIHLLVVDLTLPGTPGAEVADQIRLLRPDLPVLFASGARREQIPDGDFIGKPFDLADLAKRVAAKLANPEAGP